MNCKDLYEIIEKTEDIEMSDSVSISRSIVRYVDAYLPDAPPLEVIDLLSATPYENSPCKDKTIVFIPRSRESVSDRISVLHSEDIKIRIRKDLPSDGIKNTCKAIRKLINPINQGYCSVFCKENDYYNAVGSTKLSMLADDVYYKCTILKHMTWKLSLYCGENELPLFGCENSRYYKYKEISSTKDDMIEKLSENLAIHKLSKNYSNTIVSYAKKILEYISNPLTEHCGTSIVVFKDSNDAKNEAVRLASALPARGYLLDNHPKFNKIFNQVINIDGGLILDATGQCYAYSCIFDGVLSGHFEGDRGKGARHNSMAMYIDNKKKNVPEHIKKSCVGLVFSEDGGIKVYA